MAATNEALVSLTTFHKGGVLDMVVSIDKFIQMVVHDD